METIGDLLQVPTDFLVELTGWDSTLCFFIVLVGGIMLIGWIWRTIFGSNSSKTSSSPASRQTNSSSYDNEKFERQQREAEIRRQRKAEEDRRRANELHQNEILKGRRDTEGW